MCVLSHVWLFATLWTAAHQAPLSMGFSRQEYWSGLPFPSPGDWSHVSCISCNDRWILYHCTTWKAYCRCCCSPNHSLNGKSLCNRQWGLGLGWWWERQKKMDSKDRLGENCYWRIDVKGRELILKDRCGRRGKGIRGTQGWVSGFGNWVMVVPFIDIGKTRARTGFFFFFLRGEGYCVWEDQKLKARQLQIPCLICFLRKMLLGGIQDMNDLFSQLGLLTTIFAL